MKPYTVAVLECDTPIEPVVEKFGTYGDIFERFLQNGLQRYTQNGGISGVALDVIKSNMVEMGDPPSFAEVDCLLLSGSKHDSFKDEEWILRVVEYVRKAYETSTIPIVGICFGHQIIARALGGQVQRSPGGWEISVEKVDLTDKGAEIFGVGSLSLHQMHRDAVLKLPKDAENLGTSPACDIQGLFIPDRVLSVQAHPEFNGFIMSNILNVRHSQGVFDKMMFGNGNARALGEHDGALVGESIWKFLLGGTK